MMDPILEMAADLLIIIPYVALLIALVWIYQFIQLMLLSDVDFPGRHDKILWVAAFVLAPPVAPFAFLWWKAAYRSMLRTRESRDDQHR
jgi:hypothetical protein